jgi:hypothetical protein
MTNEGNIISSSSFCEDTRAYTTLAETCQLLNREVCCYHVSTDEFAKPFVSININMLASFKTLLRVTTNILIPALLIKGKGEEQKR